MSTKKKKTEKRTGQGFNLAINLVILSVVFVFAGYLIGQYAVNLLQQEHQTSMQATQEVATRPVVTSQDAISSAPEESVPVPPPVPTDPPVPPQSAESGSDFYRVQVGVYSERANADRMVAMLDEAGYEGVVITGPPYRVQTGAFSSQENAARLRDELHQKGFEAIIVR